MLKRIYEDKDRQERMLATSEVNWTVVRPGFLTNGGRTGEYRVITDLKGAKFGKISRADVADFMVSELENRAYQRQVVNLYY